MKIEYNNLYTHFIFTTLHREPLIPEKNRKRIEKQITGIINNNSSQLYAIYANPEHVHFLVSRSPFVSEEYEQFIKGCDLGGYNSNKFDIPLLAEEFLRVDIDIDFTNVNFIDVQVIFFKMEQRTLSAAYNFYCNKIRFQRNYGLY